jgi:hypothetical protein
MEDERGTGATKRKKIMTRKLSQEIEDQRETII